MKILFVYLAPPPKLQRLRYQQGLGSISAVLKRGRHVTDPRFLVGDFGWEATPLRFMAVEALRHRAERRQ